MTTTPRPLHFLPLPSDSPSVNIQQAHNIISDAYSRANQVLRQEDGDPIRLRLHSERLQDKILPILKALEPELSDQQWITEATYLLGSVIGELQTAVKNTSKVQHAKIKFYDPVSIVRTGKRGRPRKVIDPEFLKDAMSPSRRITQTSLSVAIHIHRNTLRTKLKQQGLQIGFNPITDEDLDRLVTFFKLLKPNSGLRYIMGYLQRHHIHIQKSRIRNALHRCDGLGQAIRNHTAIDRREYRVPRPNYLWHTDGHHKLIRYGIVIHGFVDGYDRMIIAMKASTNNLASTVLSLFLEGVEKEVAPSRVRGDRGGENIEVSVWMIQHRGPNRASFMWGSSTRNTRIERMWVEVGSQFARRWRAFFARLEDIHYLDVDEPAHLWLLHRLFLDSINQDCENFQQDWNHHPISRKGKDQSPADMRLLGQLQHGVYADDYEDVHPDILNRYYGIDVDVDAERLPGQTGAGHPSDEEDRSSLHDHIAADQENHIRHEPIEVPNNGSPFQDPALEAAFFAALSSIQAQGIIPNGYGVAQAEWDEEGYSEVELLKCGSGRKHLEVVLPFTIWWPRAVAWAQALDLLNRLQIM